MDLCTAFCAANVPFWKLEDAELWTFLEKYTGRLIPHELTIRKGYLDHCYQATLQMTFTNLKSQKV